MGLLTPREQQKVREEFHMNAHYMCDKCELPIPIDQVPVVDGYLPWPSNAPTNTRSFTSRQPKRTYHNHPCNDIRLGKRVHEYNSKGEKVMPKKEKSKKSSKKSKKSKVHVSSSEVKSASKAVMKLVNKKPGHYNKSALMRKLKETADRATVREAISSLWAKKELRKKDGNYIPVEAA